MILSIDPGKMSGYATLPHGAIMPTSGELEFTDLMYLVEAMAVNREDPLVVVMETFTINEGTARMSQAPWSLKVIGAVEWVCFREGAPEPHMRQPSAAKSFVTNDKLRALGWWHRGGGGHANDALRHLVLYLVEICGWRDPRALGES